MITRVLTVRDAGSAVAVDEWAPGAEEFYRNIHLDGRIAAEIALAEALFRVADQALNASSLSPRKALPSALIPTPYEHRAGS